MLLDPYLVNNTGNSTYERILIFSRCREVQLVLRNLSSQLTLAPIRRKAKLPNIIHSQGDRGLQGVGLQPPRYVLQCEAVQGDQLSVVLI